MLQFFKCPPVDGQELEGWFRETAGDVRSGGRAAGGSRERHGSLTDVGPRHRDARNVTLRSVIFRRYEHVTTV
jgi:hypothetical protein